MNNIKKMYADAFKAHGDSPASVLFPKGRQNLRFGKLLSHIDKSQEFSILDFGSGLSHLVDYLTEEGFKFHYTGVDICEEFLAHCREKYGGLNCRFLNFEKFQEDEMSYDHSVCVGTFNLKYLPGDEENKQFVFNAIKSLYSKSKNSLCLNFMTSEVDFIQEGAFHVSPLEFWQFSKLNLSKRIFLDSTFMPYEFNVVIFKNDLILRTENIYDI